MKKVAFDQQIYFPAKEPGNIAQGTVQSLQFMTRCVNTGLVLTDCLNAPKLSITWQKELVFQHSPKMCLDLGVTRTVDNVKKPGFYSCHKTGGNQYWMYRPETRQIAGMRGLCWTTDGRHVFAEKCDPNNQKQKWVFDDVDMSQFRPDLYPFQDETSL